MTRVLLIEPDSELRGAWRRSLEGSGFIVVETSGPHLSGSLDLGAVDVAVSSAHVPGLSTAHLSLFVRVPTILIASHGSIKQAVDVMRMGAADYLLRPVDTHELIAAIERAAACRPRSSAVPDQTSMFYPMIGRCPAMLELYDCLRKVAPTESTVLIQGESGTGKELVARALHAGSRRRHAPMISLNCAAIPETLIESELFGQERDASGSDKRTGLIESAHGGTLFLDEIGELPLEAQARLLRVLHDGEVRRLGARQTRKVDVRLLAATHRDLHKLIHTGHFREDLFYRLNVVTLSVPPLRKRGHDIVDIAEDLLRRTCERLDKPHLRLAPETVDLLTTYSWPGNVRELENAIERAVILCDETLVRPDLLAIDLAASQTPAHALGHAPEGSTSLEEYFIKFVLEHEEFLSETELAHKLGISRKSLWERRQRLGIPRRGTRKREARRDLS